MSKERVREREMGMLAAKSAAAAAAAATEWSEFKFTRSVVFASELL